jgi:TPR repeat protein
MPDLGMPVVRSLLIIGLLSVSVNLQAQRTVLDFDQGVQAAEVGNYAEAYCIWKPLANLGHADAQYRLGWLYAKGLGLAVDETEAVAWWQLAAKSGHADAMYRLGWAYEHAEGVDKDYQLAVEYYLQAAGHGHEDAQELLQLLLMKGKPDVMEKLADLLSRQPDALGEIHHIDVDRANVREQASKSGKLLVTLSRNDAVTVLGQSDQWLRVWLPDNKDFGWVFHKLVSIKEE